MAGVSALRLTLATCSEIPMGKPLAQSRLAVMPATSHTAVIMQPDLLLTFIEPFLKGETPKGMFP